MERCPQNLYHIKAATPTFLTAFGGTAASASAALIDAINDNTAYLNIHTTRFPGGMAGVGMMA